MHAVPPLQAAQHYRQPLRDAREGYGRDRQAWSAPRRDDLRGLPWHRTAPKYRVDRLQAQWPRQQGGVPNLHIPALARGGVSTIVDWDWRTMGQKKNGQAYKEENYVQGNGEHRHTYWSIKGSFTQGETWPARGRKLLPYYAWFDGDMRYTTPDAKLDPSKQPIPINSFSGSYNDPIAAHLAVQADAHNPALRQGERYAGLHASLGRGQRRSLGEFRLRQRHPGGHGTDGQAL